MYLTGNPAALEMLSGNKSKKATAIKAPEANAKKNGRYFLNFTVTIPPIIVETNVAIAKRITNGFIL